MNYPRDVDATSLRLTPAAGRRFDTAVDTRLFLLSGDAMSAPVQSIVGAEQLRLRGAAPLRERSIQLQVLHFNDLHGQLVRFYRQGDRMVFSRIADYSLALRRQCAEDPDRIVLLLSAGDDLAGSVFADMLSTDSGLPTLHASYMAYSAAGVNAAVLGNHDLDLGSEELARAIMGDAAFPLLAANLDAGPALKDLYFPAIILVTKGVRIGVVGLTTTAIQHLRSPDIRVAHPATVLHNLLPVFRPLCDVVIVLSHLGRDLNSGSAIMRDMGDVELARMLRPGDVHLIVGGHSHQALNPQGLEALNVVNGTAIVQAGMFGKYLGSVTITLGDEVRVTDAQLMPVAALPLSERFDDRLTRPLVQAVRSRFDQTLGRNEIDPDQAKAISLDFDGVGESALANFVTDAMVSRCRGHGHPVHLAMIDASVLRTNLPRAERLNVGDWFYLMPFADTIRLCWLTGRQLQTLLADNARRIGREGEPHCERGFAHFSRELRYRIRPGANGAEARVVEAAIQGAALTACPDKMFLVAFPSFFRQLAAAWEQQADFELEMPVASMRQWPMRDTGLFLRRELLAHIAIHHGVTAAGGARCDGRLQIEPDSAVEFHEPRSSILPGLAVQSAHELGAAP